MNVTHVAVTAVLLALAACHDEPPPATAPAASAQAPAASSAPAAASADPPATSTATTSADAPKASANPAYTKDLDTVCNAEARSGASGPPSEKRSMAIAKWVDANLQTKEARAYVDSLSKVNAYERGPKLRAEAQANGISPCPFADSMSKK